MIPGWGVMLLVMIEGSRARVYRGGPARATSFPGANAKAARGSGGLSILVRRRAAASARKT